MVIIVNMEERRYQVIERLGKQPGSVYRARDLQLARLVAIKRLPNSRTGTEESQRVLQNATPTCALQHPNIVAIFDGGIDETGAFLVLEHVEGETLGALVRRWTPESLPIGDFVEIVVQILEGLVAAHEIGLWHRALEPENILINWLPSRSYRVKILNFGIARHRPGQTPPSGSQTADGLIHFISPEQLNRGRVDSRSDLYAAGCIFYFALTSIAPFPGDKPEDVIRAHCQSRVVPLHYLRPDLPECLTDWLMRLIERDANDRPRSAEIALDRFHACLPSLRTLLAAHAHRRLEPPHQCERMSRAALPPTGSRP